MVRKSKKLNSTTLSWNRFEILINDPAVSEIHINSCEKICVEKNGQLLLTDFKFIDLDDLSKVLSGLEAKYGNSRETLADARAFYFQTNSGREGHAFRQQGVNSEVNAVIRFRAELQPDLDQFVEWQGFDSSTMGFLRKSVLGGKRILVIGGPGSGSQLLATALFKSFADAEKRPARLSHFGIFSLSAPPLNYAFTRLSTFNQDQHWSSAARQIALLRPDLTFFEICRGAEAWPMIRAGFQGEQILTTIIADSSDDALHRLASFAMLDPSQPSPGLVREFIAKAFDLTIRIERLPSGMRKVTELSRVTLSAGQFKLEQL